MPNTKPRCYIASPMGFSELGRTAYYNELLPRLAPHVEVVDPWREPETPLPAKPTPADWLAIGEQCLTDVESCRLVVAILDGEPADIGTVVEVAWAASKGIPVIGYRNDFRKSGEEGMPVNLMVPTVIQRSGGTFVHTIDELESAVKKLIPKLQ